VHGGALSGVIMNRVRFLFFLWTAGAAFAGEQVLLRSGFRMAVEGHLVEDGVIKLKTGGGWIELLLGEVLSVEEEEAVAEDIVVEKPVPVMERPKTADPRTLLDQAAERWGLPAEFLHSVARVESAYRVDAVSPKGAIGVMQLMPATAAILEADPHNVEQNVDAGARHLRDLLVRFDGESGKALAAYNAGVKAVERHNGIPPFTETQLYVQKVLRQYQRLMKQTVK